MPALSDEPVPARPRTNLWSVLDVCFPTRGWKVMSEQDDTLAQIVSIHPDRDLQDDEAPIHQSASVHCLHEQVCLDRDAHKVLCRRCDREVDAFAYLNRLAGDWDRYVRHRKEAKRRADEAHNRLLELLRLEKNARTRLKKLDPTAKVPPKPWGESTII